MDVKLDRHRTLVVSSFNFGVTTLTPIVNEEIIKFGNEIYRLTVEQKSPKEIVAALDKLDYIVMKLSEKERPTAQMPGVVS